MAQLDGAVRFIIAMLFSGLWQAPLFALAAWLVLRIRPNANATTRHSVLAAALFASLILPIVTAAVTLRHVPEVVRGTSDTQPPKGTVPYRPVKVGASVPMRTRDPQTTATPGLSVRSLSRPNLALPRTIALVIVAAWIAGTALMLCRLFFSLLHLERLKRDALPLAVEYRAQLTRWAAATRGSRNVRLCRSDEIAIPIAVGLFDAMILVPERLLEDLEPHDIDSIVLHELAHLRRGDDWLNAIERFAQALLFFNPGILWLVGQLDLEREVSCDDWVLQQDDALPYATCLAKVAETTVWPYRAMTAPGAFVTRRGMSIRIERLLAKHRDVRVHTSFGPAGAAVAVLALLGIVAAFAAPSIAYSVVTPAPEQAAEPLPLAAHVSTPATPKALARVVTIVTARAMPPKAPAKVVTITSAPAMPPKAPEKVVEIVASPAPPATSPPAWHHMHTRQADSEMHSGARAVRSVAMAKSPDETKALPDAEDAVDTAAVVATAKAPAYIDELAAAGYANLSVDDLVQLKAAGVSAEFIRELRHAGLTHPSVRMLVQMRAVGVDPKFIGAMVSRYGDSLSIGDIVGLKAVGVSPEYIDELSAAGLKNLSPSQVRNLRAISVSPTYVNELARAGYPNLSCDEIQQLKALDVDSAFISRAAAHGFHNLSVPQLVKLKVTEVL